MALLSVTNVNRVLHDNSGERIQVLEDINFDVQPGEFISIIGPSGCGKTTLLRLISGLDQPESGTLTVNDQEITGPDVSRGYVFQHGSLYPWMTIRDNIGIGLKATKHYDKQLVDHYLEIMGLLKFADSYPHQISGGMAQRAALARSIILKPELLLLDEPMGALDAFTRADVQNTIQQIWHDTKTTMLLVTHDIDEAIYLSNRIIIMTPRPGKIKKILTNDLAFPRDRTSDEFLKFRQKVQDELEFSRYVNN